MQNLEHQLAKVRLCHQRYLHRQSSIDYANKVAQQLTLDGELDTLPKTSAANTLRHIASIRMFGDDLQWTKNFAQAWELSLQSKNMATIAQTAASMANLYESQKAPNPINRFRFAAMQVGYSAAALSEIPGLWAVFVSIYGDGLNRTGATSQAMRVFQQTDISSRKELSNIVPDLLGSILYKEAINAFSQRDLRGADHALNACREHSAENEYHIFECLLLAAKIETVRYNFRSAAKFIEEAQSLSDDHPLNRTAATKVIDTWRALQSRRSASGRPLPFFPPRAISPISVARTYKLAKSLDEVRHHLPANLASSTPKFATAMRISDFLNHGLATS